MDEEIKENLEKRHNIKQKIFKAFAGVKLGDGIGFYEAGVIDDRLDPEDPSYQKEKAKDEREDWTRVYDMLEASDGFDQDRHCFMDAKGQHFYMPMILLLHDTLSQESVLMPNECRDSVRLELMQLLTAEQKESILDYFAYEVDYDNWLEFYLNEEGQVCPHCNTVHSSKRYTKEAAIEKIESGEHYKILKYLKNEFNL